jgi:HK97 family phage major capsid protein
MAPKLLIPTTVTELEEMLANTGTLKTVFEEGSFNELIKNYATAFQAKHDDFGKQVKAETDIVLNEWIKAQGLNPKRLDLGMRPFSPVSKNKGTGYNKRAPGVKLDGIFDDAGEFIQAMWHKGASLSNAADLSAKRDKAAKIWNDYSSTIPADGGFLIPEEFRSELMAMALEGTLVRSRARVIPMSTLTMSIPAFDSTSNVSSVFGGVVCYWTEEGGTLTESQATFQRIKLEAHKLTGYCEMPNELMRDTMAADAYFSQTFPQAMAWFEDDAFINGSGVGQPLGYRNSSAMVTVSKQAGQPADTIVWENIVKMYARMLPTSLGNAVWIASLDTFPELATMALSVGTGGSAIWLNNGVEGPPMTILGRPVIFTEKTGLLGDAGDISLVDLSYYFIGDRQSMETSSSEHFRFKDDVTAFRIISRVDGRPWINSAITPKNNGPTLSPFVQLEAR